MMRFIVKNYHSPDVYDLDNYTPDRPECFSFLLEVAVESPDSEGEEIFGIVVSTPTWFLVNNKPEDIVLGRAQIIILEFNWERLRLFLELWIETHCVGPTWRECADKLNLIG